MITQNKRTFQRLVCVNSHDRTTGSPNRFKVDFTSQRAQKVRGIELQSAYFLNSQYNITEDNNVLNFTVGGVDNTFNLPVGQYNIISFLQALNLAGDTEGLVFSFTNAITNVIQIQNDTGSELIILESSPLSQVIGLTDDLVIAIGVSGQAQNIPDLTGLKAINVELNITQGLSMDSQRNGFGSIISSIPVTSSFGSLTQYNSPTLSQDIVSFNSPQTIGHLEVRLLDQNFGQARLLNDVHLVFKIFEDI